MKKILITGDLFVLPEHEESLRAAGLSIERLASPSASEAELIAAIKGKVGYILGGNEHITRKVIDAANALQVISHCGTDYKYFMPDWRYALKKGIIITRVPNGHAHAVAEWAQAAALAMNRGLFEATSATTPGLEDQTIGIIGLGHIGSRLAGLLAVNRPKAILYHSTHRHADLESSLGLCYADMKSLLQESDIVFLCVPSSVGHNFFGQPELELMKPGALLVSFMAPGVINSDALLTVLCAGRLRAISDYPMDSRFDELPASVWHSSSVNSKAFNTSTGIRQTSDAAVKSLLKALAAGGHTPTAKASQRTRRQPKFAVLGSGIIGLAVGNVLLDTYPNARVTIYTDNAQNIVTYAAGAQFYPIWLGDNLPKGHETLLRKWFLASKRQFIAHQQSGKAIHSALNYELFTKAIPPPAYFYDVLSNLDAGPDSTLPRPYNYRYTFETMMINPLLYLPQITSDFVAKGGIVAHKQIRNQNDILRLKEPTIFNCLGANAQTIFNDQSMQKAKGVSLRLLPIPGLQTVVSAGDLIIAPRGSDTYLGAPYLSEWHTLEPTVEEQTYILDGIAALLETPGTPFQLPKGMIRKERIIEARSGLRPVRSIGPRVEKEQLGDKLIIHNYGHGGNGVILSWGTARHAVELLEA